jgi:uncharacterized protein (DUF2336 family)
MVIPEDSDNAIVDALREITESLDRSTATLNRIADHYDKIVPVMKENADTIAEANRDNRSPLDKVYESVFGEPETTN